MQALTNWIGNAYSDGYPKQNLYPGQDLAQRLVSAISIELENPKGWDPRPPQNSEEQSRILNVIRTKVADDIDSYCRDVLVRDPRVVAWLPAYKGIFGKGTKVTLADIQCETVGRPSISPASYRSNLSLRRECPQVAPTSSSQRADGRPARRRFEPGRPEYR